MASISIPSFTTAAGAGDSTATWTSPEYMLTDDGSYAYASPSGTNGKTERALLTGINFSYPADASATTPIVGFEYVIQAYCNYASTTYISYKGIINSSGTQVGALGGNYTLTTTEASYTIGGPTDAGGVALTLGDMNSTNAGIWFCFSLLPKKMSGTVSCDFAGTLKLYYVVGGATKSINVNLF